MFGNIPWVEYVRARAFLTMDEVHVLQRTEEASLDITLGDQVLLRRTHPQGGDLRFCYIAHSNPARSRSVLELDRAGQGGNVLLLRCGGGLLGSQDLSFSRV